MLPVGLLGWVVGRILDGVRTGAVAEEENTVGYDLFGVTSCIGDREREDQDESCVVGTWRDGLDRLAERNSCSDLLF